MKKTALATSTLKGLLFVIPLFGLSFLLKFALGLQSESLWPDLTSHDNRTCYFMGTSRTAAGVSPVLLQGQHPRMSFVNLGMSGSSFLYNCQLVHKAVKNESRNSLFFVELCDLRLSPPDPSYLLLSPDDIKEVVWKHFFIRSTSNDINELLFLAFNIRSDIKRLLHSRFDVFNEIQIGYKESPVTHETSTAAVLNTASLRTLPDPPWYIDAYMETIYELIAEVESSGNEIVFFLPVAVAKQSERLILLPAYKKIPPANKWLYTDEFLSRMKNRAYLADSTHLSPEGAAVFTNELSKFISDRERVAH